MPNPIMMCISSQRSLKEEIMVEISGKWKLGGKILLFWRPLDTGHPCRWQAIRYLNKTCSRSRFSKVYSMEHWVPGMVVSVTENKNPTIESVGKCCFRWQLVSFFIITLRFLNGLGIVTLKNKTVVCRLPKLFGTKEAPLLRCMLHRVTSPVL